MPRKDGLGVTASRQTVRDFVVVDLSSQAAISHATEPSDAVLGLYNDAVLGPYVIHMDVRRRRLSGLLRARRSNAPRSNP